jgi:hypothetical protein
MKRRLKIILGIAVLTFVIALLVWAFVRGRQESAMEKERERPIKAPSRVSIQDGESVVTLVQATQIKSGIAVAPLEATSHQKELQAYGTVVEPQELVDLRNRYVAAKAQVKMSQATLEASHREYERLKALHGDKRNISDKTLQAAEASWRSDEANAHAAQEALHAIKGTARQRWGRVLAQWLFDASAAFDRLMNQQDVLIQVTLPSGEQISSVPQTAWVQAANGTFISAVLVSPSPRTDPRIQGMSFFYITSIQPDFLPGMNIIAYLPVGSGNQGVVVPDSAVVWWQGKAWVYVQKGTDQFIRREISTETPVKDGWFISKGLREAEMVVVNGSQLLLSEESRSQIQVGD